MSGYGVISEMPAQRALPARPGRRWCAGTLSAGAVWGALNRIIVHHARRTLQNAVYVRGVTVFGAIANISLS
jgi:hypothetical protein